MFSLWLKQFGTKVCEPSTSLMMRPPNISLFINIILFLMSLGKFNYTHKPFNSILREKQIINTTCKPRSIKAFHALSFYSFQSSYFSLCFFYTFSPFRFSSLFLPVFRVCKLIGILTTYACDFSSVLFFSLAVTTKSYSSFASSWILDSLVLVIFDRLEWY